MPLPSGKAVMDAATRVRGVDSFATMPIKWIGDLVGKIINPAEKYLSKDTLGSKAIEYGIVAPSEKLTTGLGSVYNKYLGEIPGIGGLTKYKVTPKDVADASKRLNFSPEHISKLLAQSGEGKLISHRITAPLESSAVKAIALPLAGTMYLHEKLDNYQAGAPARNQANVAAKGRLNRIRQYAGLTKQSEEVMSRQQELMKSAGMQLKAQSDEITRLQDLANTQSKVIGLYKEAATLVANQVLRPENIDVWVGQSIQSSSMPEAHQPKIAETSSGEDDLSSLYSNINSNNNYVEAEPSRPIPKYAASIGEVYEGEGETSDVDISERRKHPGQPVPIGKTANSYMNDFVSGSINTGSYPGS